MRSNYIKYSAEKIIVNYNPKLCIHAAECVIGLPNVFDPNKKPWISPENANADELKKVIERCPSGALKYEVTENEGNEKFNKNSEIKIIQNGPLYFTGEILISDSEGNEVAHEGRAALCRCGASKNKPFCDNSHLEVNFNG
jgi:uncharacterized Fe-S cluster protein YjdI